jgi:hypothetical protein
MMQKGLKQGHKMLEIGCNPQLIVGCFPAAYAFRQGFLNQAGNLLIVHSMLRDKTKLKMGASQPFFRQYTDLNLDILLVSGVSPASGRTDT